MGPFSGMKKVLNENGYLAESKTFSEPSTLQVCYTTTPIIPGEQVLRYYGSDSPEFRRSLLDKSQ